jgi:putative transposase
MKLYESAFLSYHCNIARITRVICSGIPNYIILRGNRRQPSFFCDEGYLAYIKLMGNWCRKHEVAIWAWCLMPNHVHLIAVPQTETGLAPAIGEAYRRYTRRINFRVNWRGHLWQERFASFPMDENKTISCRHPPSLHDLIPSWKALLRQWLQLFRTMAE